MSKPLSSFTEQTIKIIKKIPNGKVASYSQIAALAGKPGAARAVVWILHSCSDKYKLPWHRVVNAKGRIAFNSKKYQIEQRRLLERESITFIDKEHVDLSMHLWKPKSLKTKDAPNRPKIFQS